MVNKSSPPKRKSIPSRLRHEVFKRDGYRCRECGATNKETKLEIDHIVPVSKGGTNDITNLQVLCKTCNRAKYNRTWVGGQVDDSYHISSSNINTINSTPINTNTYNNSSNSSYRKNNDVPYWIRKQEKKRKKIEKREKRKESFKYPLLFFFLLFYLSLGVILISSFFHILGIKIILNIFLPISIISLLMIVGISYI